MKTPEVQAHAEAIIRKVRESLDRFPDTPILECGQIAGNQYTQPAETLVLDIGGDREYPDRLVIRFERRYQGR